MSCTATCSTTPFPPCITPGLTWSPRLTKGCHKPSLPSASLPHRFGLSRSVVKLPSQRRALRSGAVVRRCVASGNPTSLAKQRVGLERRSSVRGVQWCVLMCSSAVATAVQSVQGCAKESTSSCKLSLVSPFPRQTPFASLRRCFTH